jgi:hypothetical protein
MFESWQDVVAALLALGALIYLIRRRLRARARACEGCGPAGCAPTPAATRPTLVAISIAPPTARRARPE